ncbi:Cyclic nucleotide-binding domain-containing protein [Plasmodiophora brassicae]
MSGTPAQRRLRRIAQAALGRCRQNVIVNRLSETRSTQKEKALIERSLEKFSNQASLRFSGFEDETIKGSTPSKVVSRLELSPNDQKRTRTILARNGPARSLPDALHIVAILRKLHVPVLSDLTDPQLTWLATCVTGLHVDPGTDVFRYDDVGTLFYVVCSGSLGVFVPVAPGVDPSQDANLTQVGVLSSGRGFGERSLLDGDPRKATVRALQPSLLICMDRTQFLWMMRTLFDRQVSEKLAFFTSMPMCRRWSRRDLLRFALPFERSQLRRGAIVARQDEICKQVMVVADGYLVVQRRVEYKSTGVRMLVQICSIGRGCIVEVNEVLKGLPIRNSVVSPLQSNVDVYSVALGDLLSALRASPRTMEALLTHAEVSGELSESNFESAATGTIKRNLKFAGLAVAATIKERKHIAESQMQQVPPLSLAQLERRHRGELEQSPRPAVKTPRGRTGYSKELRHPKTVRLPALMSSSRGKRDGKLCCNVTSADDRRQNTGDTGATLPKPLQFEDIQYDKWLKSQNNDAGATRPEDAPAASATSESGYDTEE